MTEAPAAADAALPPPAKRGLREILTELRRPKVALMLALGISSGLPFMLIGNTLGFWLADDGVKLAAIGFLSWAGLSYSFKFIWGAVVDRLPAPVVGWLGRRRGWMIASQLVVGAALIGMAAVDPKTHLGWFAVLTVIAGIAAASQDTVIDAWRIESADDADELGLLTAAYTLGYRLALILTEAVILLVVQALGWPLAYAIYGAAMGVGVVATLMAREPAKADAVMREKTQDAARRPLAAAYDAVVGPLIAFFRSHGVGLAALMLGMITLYHLCDYMRGPMTNPYYHALNLSKGAIAAVRVFVGTPSSLAGIALGGFLSLRIGNLRNLILGALLQPIAVAAFALLGWHGGDYALVQFGSAHVSAFEAIMGFDSFVMGLAGMALVSYMSTLTSLGYTATQYALLTSALALTGKFLKGFSGTLVVALQHGRTLLDAYALFYLLSAAIGLPAILLCLILARISPAPGRTRG
jgi:PAT family beta-lactamase induction signal transducer AmpG